MLRSRCRGVRRADCRRQGILRGCRRQIARGCPVAVLASARSRRLPDLTPGGLWTSPPPAADGTRGRTGREDGALGAISSRASRDNPGRRSPPSAKTASKRPCAVPGLLQRSVPAGLRPSRPRSPGALSVGCPGVTGVCGRVRRWAAENCSGAAKLGAADLGRRARLRGPGGACGGPARPHPPLLAVPGHVHPSSTGAASAVTRRAAPGSRSGRRRARRPAAACPPGLHAASRHPSDGVGHRAAHAGPGHDADVQARNHPPVHEAGREASDSAPATSRRRSPCSNPCRRHRRRGRPDPVPDDVVEDRVGLHTPGHADLAATAQRSVARHVDRTR